MEPVIWTVSQLTRYLQALLQSSEPLQDLWVRGEISSLSRPVSGHLFFTLKDERAQVRCVIWQEHVAALQVQPENGMAVEVHGYLDVYGPRGTYQLYVDQVRPLGEGALFQAFLRLKARLEAEGLFAQHRKRALPRFPQVIGVVTSLTGAALRDILRTLSRRYPLAEVWVVPTLVQGEEAPEQLVRALEHLAQAGPDVIILARGGGSWEDLWAFNDERVVRAVAASPVPVVTGVGHETDFTLVDFAADVRAPTPTGAAEVVAPERAALVRQLQQLAARLRRAWQARVRHHHQELNLLARRLALVAPQRALRQEQLRLEEWRHRLERAAQRRWERELARWDHWFQRWRAVDPLAALRRGFALVYREGERVVRSAREVTPGERLDVYLAQGRLEVRVERIDPEAAGPPTAGSG